MKSEKEEALEQIRNTQAELYERLADLDREIAALSIQHEESPAPDETIESSTVASQEPVRTQGALAAAPFGLSMFDALKSLNNDVPAPERDGHDDEQSPRPPKGPILAH